MSSQSTSNNASSANAGTANIPDAPQITLDSICAHITTSTSPATLAQNLRACAPRDTRDKILAGTLSNGADPLVVLDARTHTVGVLYILCALFVFRAGAALIG